MTSSTSNANLFRIFPDTMTLLTDALNSSGILEKDVVDGT
jgi:hypothetical protein